MQVVHSALDDGLCPSSESRDTSASPSSYLLTVHDDDNDVTPLFSLQNATPGGSSDGEVKIAFIIAQQEIT